MVLPFVPVTPATVSRSVGAPKNASAATASRRARGLDDDLRHGDVDRPLDDERGRPGPDGLGGELVTVPQGARDAEEERALADGAGVVRQVDDLDGPPPDHLLRRERADQRVELHPWRL